jgi:hypothetical protein
VFAFVSMPCLACKEGVTSLLSDSSLESVLTAHVVRLAMWLLWPGVEASLQCCRGHGLKELYRGQNVLIQCIHLVKRVQRTFCLFLQSLLSGWVVMYLLEGIIADAYSTFHRHLKACNAMRRWQT